MDILELEDGNVELDEAGCLKDFGQWSEEVARALAERDGLELTEGHLKVIRTIRSYYEEHKVPPMLTLVSKMCGMSFKDLHELFQKQPGKRAAKLAGLPKASGCT
jgi:TusE/DsrC/DsvC family sulfur relay protein